MNPLPRAAWLILLLALLLRVGYLVATPDQTLVHDAVRYDRIAKSVAQGHGYPYSRVEGRNTAFRPPAYPYLLAGAYELAGVGRAPMADRVLVGRLLGLVTGTLIVGLIGIVADAAVGSAGGARRDGARRGLHPADPRQQLADVGAPVRVAAPRRARRGAPAPALRRTAGAGCCSPASSAASRSSRGRTRWSCCCRSVLAVWTVRPRFSPRALAGPAVLVVLALVTVSPWTIRNAVVMDRFIPVSTQLGSALAGTYNDQARTDKENPASWRSIRHVPEYRSLYNRLREIPEAEVEVILRERSKAYIREHPTYPFKVALWTSLRMLELGGMDWSRHTASTISIGPRWANAGVICFWVFALLALAGAFTRQARRTPLFVWLIPVLLYLSVVFLVVETPRYRTGIDPFIVMLAALALLRALPGGGDREPPPPDRARYRTSPKAPTPA